MPGIEPWQMCPKADEHSQGGCREDALISEEKKNTNYSFSLDFLSCSKLSTVSTMSEGSSPILVYCRKKLQRTSISKLSTVSTMSESSAPNFVYQRKKLRGNSIAVFSVQTPADRKKNGDCNSVISSDAASAAANEQHLVSQLEHETESVNVCNRETHVLKSLSVNKCPVLEEHSSDGASKISMHKIIDVDSINDSCSSSKSNMELASGSKKTEVDDPGECSSSSVIAAEIMEEYPSEKDFCISILRSHGQLEEVWPGRTSDSAEGSGNNSHSCFLSCKICGHSETMINMLICDNCEEAFHVSCCNPRKKNVPVDEWLCHSCLKRKCLKETNIMNSPSITREMGKNKNASFKCESNPITLMLRDTEPYTTGVRIGKGFQADVPDWSGPIAIDVDVIHEPLEMDPLERISFHEFNPGKPSKLSFIGNWLQCREMIDSAEEGVNGTICGKWRRAPLFATQTDDWECFCSVFWDPSHADCAVPQELETDQVLQQLKYIEKLRPRLAAQRQKFDSTKSSGSRCVKNETNIKT